MSANGQTITLADGRRLGYAAVGPADGRPVMYFHGTPGSRLDADALDVEALAQKRGVRLFYLERPGFGLSDRSRGRRVADWADDVRQFADELGIDRFSVLGYSGGGPHALACGARLEDRVTAVASVSGVGVPGTPGAYDGMGPNERLFHRLVRISPRLVSGAYRYARRTLDRNPDRFFSDFEKDCSDSDRKLIADPAFREAIRGSILEALRTGVGGAVDDWVVLERRPWGFAPEDVHVPTLLVFGEADRIVLPASGRELARRMSHARVVEVPGEGHMLILARLGEILDDLVAESGAAPHEASVAEQPPG